MLLAVPSTPFCPGTPSIKLTSCAHGVQERPPALQRCRRRRRCRPPRPCKPCWATARTGRSAPTAPAPCPASCGTCRAGTRSRCTWINARAAPGAAITRYAACAAAGGTPTCATTSCARWDCRPNCGLLCRVCTGDGGRLRLAGAAGLDELCGAATAGEGRSDGRGAGGSRGLAARCAQWRPRNCTLPQTCAPCCRQRSSGSLASAWGAHQLPGLPGRQLASAARRPYPHPHPQRRPGPAGVPVARGPRLRAGAAAGAEP